MGKREEIWKSVFEYWWRGWQIMKDKGWYSIMLRDADAGTVCIPLKFRRLGEAKKYCETLDTLVDRKSLPAGYLDKTICAQACPSSKPYPPKKSIVFICLGEIRCSSTRTAIVPLHLGNRPANVGG